MNKQVLGSLLGSSSPDKILTKRRVICKIKNCMESHLKRPAEADWVYLRYLNPSVWFPSKVGRPAATRPAVAAHCRPLQALSCRGDWNGPLPAPWARPGKLDHSLLECTSRAALENGGAERAEVKTGMGRGRWEGRGGLFWDICMMTFPSCSAKFWIKPGHLIPSHPVVQLPCRSVIFISLPAHLIL